MTDVWTEASRDVVAEQRAYGLEMAKSAGAGAWSFLALARSHEEFADRVALAQDSIVRAASSAGISPNDLLQVFAERFALLMEAGENPFADKDDTGDGDDEDDHDDSGDDSDKDEHGDGQSDDSGDDDAKDDDKDKSNSDVDDAGTDETDDNGTDGGDDESQDDGGDDNADDSESGHDKDDDQEDDVDGREASPAFGGIYSSLMQRINAGEDPLTWGGRPFVGSLGRTAVGADMPPVSDSNVPTPPDPMAGAGMGGTSAPITTKPRQLPGGAQSLSTPPADPGIDPAANGGDIEAGANTDPDPVTAKLNTIAATVRRANPGLSALRCHAVALEVLSRYQVVAEDVSPLLFGDRNNVPDGPLTHKVKNWEPPSPMGGGKKPASPGEGSQDDSGPDEGGEGGEGAGEGAGAGEAAEGAAGAGEAAGAAGAAGEVAELAPLLLL